MGFAIFSEIMRYNGDAIALAKHHQLIQRVFFETMGRARVMRSETNPKPTKVRKCVLYKPYPNISIYMSLNATLVFGPSVQRQPRVQLVEDVSRMITFANTIQIDAIKHSKDVGVLDNECTVPKNASPCKLSKICIGKTGVDFI